MISKTRLCVAALATALAAAGCISTPAPSQKLFVLPTGAPTGTRPQPGVLDGKILGVGPVEVASHLDRQIVAVRLEETRYEYADSLRWASPTRTLLAERLEEGMSWATGAAGVTRFPWPSDRKPDVQVQARFVRFELTRSGTAEIAAHWAVRDGADGKNIRSGYFTHAETIQGASGTAGIEALDRALFRFAQALAGEIR